MTEPEFSSALRKSLHSVANDVHVPDPPSLPSADPPAKPRRVSGWVVLAASAAVVAVTVGGVAITRLQTDEPGGPAGEVASSASPAEESLPPGKSPRLAIVNGSKIVLGDTAIDTGLEVPLSGSSSALAAVVRDGDGVVWNLALDDPTATPERWGSRAVTSPVLAADERSGLWLEERLSGLVLAAAHDGATAEIVRVPLPASLSSEDPDGLTVGMDQLSRAFVGNGRETWVIDWWENLAVTDFTRVDGVDGGLAGVFANEIIVKDPEGRLAWGYVSGGSSPAFRTVGAIEDATSLAITASAVFALTLNGELVHLETRSGLISDGGQTWPVLEPTGDRRSLDLPSGTDITAVTGEGRSVLVVAASSEEQTDVIRCSAKNHRCEHAATLGPDERLLMTGTSTP